MSKTFVRAIIALFCLIPPAPVAASAPPQTVSYPADAISYKMGKLALDDIDAYYGAATLFRIENGKGYFLTNSHVLPPSPARLERVRMQGIFSGFEQRPITLVGRAPGYDLAVISTPLDVQALERLGDTTRLEENFAPAPNEPVHVAIIGVPTFQPEVRQILKNQTWPVEARALSMWTALPELIARPELMLLLSADTLRLEPQTDCPPVFARTCYHVPIRSWGYSGGNLIVAKDQRARPTIAGVISHFSPLAETTYVIPSATALDVAKRIVAKAKDSRGPVEEALDDTGAFEWVGPGRVRIRPTAGGDLVGKVVEGLTAADIGGGETTPGGHDSSGGGGETTPGGHDSSGGGGETTPGGHDSSGGGGSGPGGHDSSGGGGYVVGQSYFQLDAFGHIAGLSPFARLKELVTRPETWHQRDNALQFLFSASPALRGVSALFRYQPGVRIDKKIYHRYDGKPISTLQSFLTAYRAGSRGKLEQEPARFTAPPILASGADQMGLNTSTFVNKLMGLADLVTASRRQPSAQITWDEVAMLLSQVRGNGRLRGVAVDVVSARNRLDVGGTVARSALDLRGDEARLDYVVPRHARCTLTFPNRFVQRGEEYLQYRGKLTYDIPSEDEKSGKRESFRVDGIVSLQKGSRPGDYEVKVVLAYVPPAKWFDETWRTFNPLFVPAEEIMVEGLYFPLRRADSFPRIDFTDDERTRLRAFEAEQTRLREQNADSTPLSPPPAGAQAAVAQSVAPLNRTLDELARRLESPDQALPAAQRQALQARIDEMDRLLRTRERALGIEAPPLIRFTLEVQTMILEERVRALDARIRQLESGGPPRIPPASP